MSTPPETMSTSPIVGGSGDVAALYPSESLDDVVRTPARPIKVIRPPSFSISTIFTGLRTLAQYSDLLYTLSLFRLSVRYKQSVLGYLHDHLHSGHNGCHGRNPLSRICFFCSAAVDLLFQYHL